MILLRVVVVVRDLSELEVLELVPEDEESASAVARDAAQDGERNGDGLSQGDSGLLLGDSGLRLVGVGGVRVRGEAVVGGGSDDSDTKASKEVGDD